MSKKINLPQYVHNIRLTKSYSPRYAQNPNATIMNSASRKKQNLHSPG